MADKESELIKALHSKFHDDPSSLTDGELMTLMLSYSKCAPNASAVAENILSRFGSLYSGFNATPDELMNVDGVSENAAILMSVVSTLSKEKKQVPKKGTLIRDVEMLFRNAVECGDKEAVYIAAFDAEQRLISFNTLGHGTRNSVMIGLSDIVDYAVCNKAAKIAIAHNHPVSGNMTESDYDELSSEAIGMACGDMGIEFIGQVIVTGNGAKLYPYKRS